MIKFNDLSRITVLVFLSITFSVTSQTEEPMIQRVRIDFKSPTNYVKHLLLSFVSDDSATDGVDYGYDTKNMDQIPYDLNWLIEEDQYVIQGVGKFHDQRHYPFWMSMMNSGEVEISLVGLENFETDIPVYIYDKVTKDYYLINDNPLSKVIEDGEYADRFHIAFSLDNAVLSTEENKISRDFKIYYEDKSQSLTVDVRQTQPITKLVIYNVAGKILHSQDYANVQKIDIKNGRFKDTILILHIEQGSKKSQKIIVAQ